MRREGEELIIESQIDLLRLGDAILVAEGYYASRSFVGRFKANEQRRTTPEETIIALKGLSIISSRTDPVPTMRPLQAAELLSEIELT